MRIKTLVLVGLLTFTPLAFQPLWAHEKHVHMHSQAQDNITVMVNLTDDKGLKPTMALKFALVSLQRGNKTVVWLNSEAVRLADAKVKETKGVKALKEFISAGGKVYVCPHCAKVLGVEKLIEGAELGSPDKVFGVLSEERVRVISW